jgi:GT2 family glycosyltransferase/glycosyltransferase involved in cell wall biosynthesis
MAHTGIDISDTLLVSGPNGGGVALFSGTTLVRVSRRSATGIANAEHGVAWCLQGDGEANEILGLDGGKVARVALADDELDLHDLRAFDHGWLAVATHRNAVLSLDGSWRETGRWEFPGEPDSMHINSCCVADGRILASAFGEFQTHRGYKGATRGAGLVLDLETRQTVLDGLSQPHSLLWHGGQLHLCDSERNEVVFYAGERDERRVELPGYTRGLHIGERHAYVGLSRSRNESARRNVDRFDGAAVAVLRWPGLEVLGYVQLPWSEIYDIRPVPPGIVPALASLAIEELDSEIARMEASSTAEAANLRHRLEESQAELVLALKARSVHERERAELIDQLAASERERARLLELLATSERARLQLTEAASERAASHAALQAEKELLDRELTATRGALANADAELSRLQGQERVLDQVVQSRSWRWTRIFRMVARTVRNRGLAEDDREQLRRMWRSARPFSAQVSVTVPARQASGMEDVYVWSVIDWHFRIQRPQHLARSLSGTGRRVFYVSNNFVDDAQPGFEAEPLDASGRLFQVRLHLAGCPSIYRALPSPEQLLQLDASLRMLREWHGGRGVVNIVQHAYWAVPAERVPAATLVYDCMDHHAGFADNSSDIEQEEARLAERADLTVVTSDWLHREMSRGARRVATVRNACEYEFFATHPGKSCKGKDGRQVIGYYGAIADWFDVGLVEQVATAYPHARVVLVGADTVGASRQLSHLANVELVGEVPYRDLPYWLHGFDVCILPFRIVPLTLATNPVKVYEYLAAGKQVVSVDLPELAQFEGHVAVARDNRAFLDAVGDSLRLAGTEADQCAAEARRAFASTQTWTARAEQFQSEIAAARPALASIVVVTYNNLDFTKACLASIDAETDWPETEVIVVDNASADGTPDFLQEWAAGAPNRHVILNQDNRGFSAANNQGAAHASGEYLVFLNNDTYVTPGWLRGLISPLYRNGIGLTGPTTNNIGNEARIEIAYGDMEEMRRQACLHTGAHRGELLPIDTLAFFCVAMRRRVWESIGPLDEAFGIGFFEDDDYCRRVGQAELRCCCVEDVFVHHHLSASFDAMAQMRRQALFETNRAIYEAKWGPWRPHAYRQSASGPG